VKNLQNAPCFFIAENANFFVSLIAMKCNNPDCACE